MGIILVHVLIYCQIYYSEEVTWRIHRVYIFCEKCEDLKEGDPRKHKLVVVYYKSEESTYLTYTGFHDKTN